MRFGTCWGQWGLPEDTKEQNWSPAQTRGTHGVMGDAGGPTEVTQTVLMIQPFLGKDAMPSTLHLTLSQQPL